MGTQNTARLTIATNSFQNVQRLSALESSLRFLPSIVVGIGLELTTGFFIHRLPVLHLVLISSMLSAGAPLLMALINSKWPYWYDAFPAQVSCVGSDQDVNNLSCGLLMIFSDLVLLQCRR